MPAVAPKPVVHAELIQACAAGELSEVMCHVASRPNSEDKGDSSGATAAGLGGRMECGGR